MTQLRESRAPHESSPAKTQSPSPSPPPPLPPLGPPSIPPLPTPRSPHSLFSPLPTPPANQRRPSLSPTDCDSPTTGKGAGERPEGTRSLGPSRPPPTAKDPPPPARGTLCGKGARPSEPPAQTVDDPPTHHGTGTPVMRRRPGEIPVRRGRAPQGKPKMASPVLGRLYATAGGQDAPPDCQGRNLQVRPPPDGGRPAL